MSFSADFDEYHIADERRPVVTTETIDESYGETPEDFVREENFVTGVSSHSKVADVDEVKNKTLKIGSPPQVPGKKVAVPNAHQNKKVAVPNNLSKWGDFRRTIQMSAEDPDERERCKLKLYESALNPLTTQVRRGR